MAEPLVRIELSGALLTSISESTVATECSCEGPQPSASFNFALKRDTKWADAENSSRRTSITSPAAFVTLAMPAVGSGYVFLGRLFYFKALDADASWIVRLGYSTSDDTELPVTGMLLLEPPEADAITAVAVQGTGAFEWAITGLVAAD